MGIVPNSEVFLFLDYVRLKIGQIENQFFFTNCTQVLNTFLLFFLLCFSADSLQQRQSSLAEKVKEV